LYDPTKGALSLYNLLQANGRNVNSGNSLALNVYGLDAKSLQKDLKRLHETDPLVAVLLEVRDRYHIHREARLTGTGTFSSLPELSYKQIDHLLKRAGFTVRKFCRLYGKSVLSERFAGTDDYTRVRSPKAGLAVPKKGQPEQK
jgi:hypothetical protein